MNTRFLLLVVGLALYRFAMMRPDITVVMATRRIVVHILMMKRKIIMTIKICVETSRDLGVENNVFNFELSCRNQFDGLMAVAWFLCDDSEKKLLEIVLDYIVKLASERLMNRELWLLSGNSAWQNNSRIVNYWKLWRSYGSRGIEVSDFINKYEYFISSESKIKFLGAACFTEKATNSVVKIVIDERNSYVVFVPGGFDLKNIVESGWSGDLCKDIELFSPVIDGGGILLKKYGGFDDVERGFLAFGKPGVLEVLVD